MRIGLVGAGPWASDTHAPALAAHRGVDFVGVWARRPEAVERFGAPVYPSYPALLDAVDAVAFAVPPAVQSAMATHAAQMGKHLILDKPIAANLAEAQELAEAVDAAGVGSVVMLTRRFAPETREFLADAAQHHWGRRGGDVAVRRRIARAVLGLTVAARPGRLVRCGAARTGPTRRSPREDHQGRAG